MVLALIPTAAFAADGDTIHVGGVALTGSEAEPAYALTDDSGSVTTEGAGESSYNIRWDGSTLTLNNATITQGYSQGYYKGAVTAISWSYVYDNRLPSVRNSWGLFRSTRRKHYHRCFP